MTAAEPEARAREEDEEPDQRDANKPLEAPERHRSARQAFLGALARFLGKK